MPTPNRRSARLLDSTVFRTFLLSLMALLFLAFWLLCSHQVRQYESRRLAQQVRLTAFGDCLQYVVHSTIASCTHRLGAAGGAGPGDALPNALPVPPGPLVQDTFHVGAHAMQAVARTLPAVAAR